LAIPHSEICKKSNRTFGYLSAKKPALSWMLYAAWPFITLFTERIFREDKEIVEKEQCAYDAQGVSIKTRKCFHRCWT